MPDQAAYYYRHFKHDNWMLKLLVSSAIAIDSVSIIANYASVYLYTVTHWGHFAYLENQTKNNFIALTLFLLITVAIGGAFACALTIAIFPGYKDRGKVVIPGTIWLITEAVTDISIGSALLLEFWKAKSSFKETRSLLNRLVAQTIQTGTAGASIALAVLVTFLVNKESNVPTGIAYCLGRVYCITMLANLNSRKTRNGWSGKSTSSGANPETRGERGNQERSEAGDDYGVIHVHRTALVHIDTPPEFSRGSFKTNGHPDDSPAVEIEMTVNDSAFYSSKKKQNPFAP
ncbi:hypothetical protein B0H14DRAFT_3737230 [Mycena olivaceomarginata]|nr:hypothetical protein B0H14DRAFT_3652755 [Mycena olivaceomarginata]KAJ7885289.1 hypothetical protein B0H14DRAFT_3737230 [Mycena olivaceomarginata]